PIIEKREDQKLITSGIYGMVRHPLYLSGLLILAGTNIYFGSKWAWVGTVAAMVIILVRIPLEEKKLIKRFSQEYISYRRHTKRILPWIF
ncbi:MAG TPA: isoprenylcysteine carboxylmethyltransferase family protein, partial [Clostridia bacterium]|nr:isoprenylcysteine carboxylmethyltransferase family protein [Clostridia bacterium]